MPFSSIDPLLQEKLTEFKEAYDKAESVIKFCEVHQAEGVGIAAINELRYAGQHIARAFSALTVEDSIKNVNNALRHVHRSMYDSYDACIMFYLMQCKIFEESYKNICITSINNNYINEKKILEQIKSEISKENRNNKENYCKIKEEQINTVKNVYETWFLCREELNKLSRKQLHETWWKIIIGITIPITLWIFSNLIF